jgi:transposase-like protein
VDWNKIKAEYIAGGTSYRKLCAKYGVSRTTLQRKAKDEKWLDLRSQAEAKTESKIVNVISEKKADIDKKYFTLVDKLMQRAEEVIENTPVWQVNSLKEMATALKYLKECKGVKSDIDLREQEARIKNLEKQAMAEDNELQEIRVTFGGASSEEARRWAE